MRSSIQLRNTLLSAGIFAAACTFPKVGVDETGNGGAPATTSAAGPTTSATSVTTGSSSGTSQGDGGATTSTSSNGGASGSSSSQGGASTTSTSGGSGGSGGSGSGNGGAGSTSSAGGGPLTCEDGCVPSDDDAGDCDADGDANATDCGPCASDAFHEQTAFFDVPFELADGTPSFDYDCSGATQYELIYESGGCTEYTAAQCPETTPIYTTQPACGQFADVQDCVVTGAILGAAGSCGPDMPASSMRVRCH